MDIDVSGIVVIKFIFTGNDMIELIGSKFCMACGELKRSLDRRGIDYTFHDESTMSERYLHLQQIADDDGYTAHPAAFYNEECLGEGTSVINRIDDLIDDKKAP